MNKITVFETRDGTRFAKESQARTYERLLDKINVAMIPLGTKRPNSNGENYIRHNRTNVKEFNKRANALIKGRCARELNDGNSPLYWLWIIQQQIDSENREWGQIYYANHPNEDAKCIHSNASQF